MHARYHNAIVLLATYAGLTGASAVFAHEGHGLTGSHWHSTDLWGFLATVCLAAAAIGLSRRGK